MALNMRTGLHREAPLSSQVIHLKANLHLQPVILHSRSPSESLVVVIGLDQVLSASKVTGQHPCLDVQNSSLRGLDHGTNARRAITYAHNTRCCPVLNLMSLTVVYTVTFSEQIKWDDLAFSEKSKWESSNRVL